MEDYINWSHADFIADNQFRQWVLHPTPLTDKFWSNWLKQHPEKAPILDAACQIVLGLKVQHQPLSDENIRHLVNATIQQAITQTSPILIPAKRKKNSLVLIAAVFSIALISILSISKYNFVNLFHLPQSTYSESLIEKSNTSAEPLRVQLPDKSTVTLFKNSKITYKPSFNGPTREITLYGVAFFQITKNQHKPFLVYANGVTTKVLGTSFLIKSSLISEETIVEVKTGKVAVFSGAEKIKADHESGGIVLTPNQRVVYNRKSKTIQKAIVDKPSTVNPSYKPQTITQEFEFHDMPISQVFASLEQAYGIEIVYDKNAMQNCPLTASLSTHSYFEKLEVICKAIEATYEVKEGVVIIKGNGCNI